MIWNHSLNKAEKAQIIKDWYQKISRREWKDKTQLEKTLFLQITDRGVIFRMYIFLQIKKKKPNYSIEKWGKESISHLRESNNIKTINNQMPIYNRKYRTCNYTMEYYIATQNEWYTTTCKKHKST